MCPVRFVTYVSGRSTNGHAHHLGSKAGLILTSRILAFMAGALRLTASSGIEKTAARRRRSATARQMPKEFALSDPRTFHAPQSSYTKQDLLRSSEGGYFGPGNAQLPAPPMLMIDRITEISLDGGEFGKGHVIAELDITPSLWFFDSHFLGDPVMPGCLGMPCGRSSAIGLAGRAHRERAAPSGSARSSSVETSSQTSSACATRSVCAR
jgi:hypothetical protein